MSTTGPPRRRVPDERIAALNDAPARAGGEFVLYWMIAYRRSRWNFALERAIEWARELKKPLVVLEGLRCEYGWASDRLHRFVIDGMADNAARFEKAGILYHPYVEPERSAGKGLLAALGKRACAAVTDDFPCFLLPRMAAAAGRRLPVLLEMVDSNGLLPMAAARREFTTAHSFRRFLQKSLRPHLERFPAADPLAGIDLPRLRSLPAEIGRRWPRADGGLLDGRGGALDGLPIDHSVPPGPLCGGPAAAEKAWRGFLEGRIDRYPDDRDQPESDGTSGMSPYLHFGHISAHQLFHDLMARERWTPRRLAPKATGSREGWWGAGAAVEAFLDQLVTWREIGFNLCHRRGDYDRFESLPDWALKTLRDHERDRREPTYELGDFEAGRTHDPLWNAAQMQLVREGRLHNYLRMLWGKKILEWTESPRRALEVMIELNNKYALDGRDPNSYSGIFWVLGRYDRAWGPERPIFGKVRYMSSESAARKLRVREFIPRYAP